MPWDSNIRDIEGNTFIRDNFLCIASGDLKSGLDFRGMIQKIKNYTKS